MKKRFLGLFLALTCLLLPILTSCGDDVYEDTMKVKPMTITLYGITGESTTDEAVLAVQDALNQYTEGNLNTRVLLRFFTEDEYYEELDKAIAKAQEYKKEQENLGYEDIEDDKVSGDDRFEVVFEEEKGTQVDIFMVRGADMLEKYVEREVAATIKIEEKNSIIAKYISPKYLALTSQGKATENGLVDSKAKLYGVPCNYVTGEYTYLLVNKEIAGIYGYSEADLDTLDELSYYVEDVANNHRDYIPLYNAPEQKVVTIGNTLIGGVINNDTNAFSTIIPQGIFSNPEYVSFQKNLQNFTHYGYITEGDDHSLPEGENIGAAFIKGNAALPAEYEDEYMVITYAKPCVDDLGTVFCVSSLAADNARCLEVISTIMTNPSYRNTLQYGVENIHYKVNDYTHEYEIISDDYSMNYADTGNMFILEPNTSMSEEMLALAKNDWELAKQQYRDAIINPYSTPLMRFDLTYYDETNYTQGEWYQLYVLDKIDELAAIEMEKDEYKNALQEAIVVAKAEAEAKGTKFNETKFIEKYAKTFKNEFGYLYEVVAEGNVEETVEELIEYDDVYIEAYEAAMAAAKSEATAKGEEFDEDDFTEQYVQKLAEEIRKTYVFDYELEYTADLIAKVEALTETYLNEIRNFDFSSGKIEYRINYLAEAFKREATVKVILDIENPDSVISQYQNWARSIGINLNLEEI